jgi:hypothetical protein
MNWFGSMAACIVLALAHTSAVAADNGHSGIAVPRTGPELSDIALFVAAALALWLTRRALRKRAQKLIGKVGPKG